MSFSEIQNSEVVVFKPEIGQGEFQVILDGDDDTVWVTEQQIVELFGKARRTIGGHIKNIYDEGELEKESTWREFRQVQKEGARNVSRKVSFYNLDIIISVGYRVKSPIGVEFRKWATLRLKEYLLKGYTINQNLLREKTKQLNELKGVIKLQEKVFAEHNLNTDQTEGLIKIISQYSKALDLLDDYDHQRLSLPKSNNKEVFKITYKEARSAIDELGKYTHFEGLFGREKDDSFKGSIENIHQTFDGVELYSTIDEKAAHLLYFVVKNHAFTDGNKRIAAYLFVWFLDRNNSLYNSYGDKVIPDNALVALTLLIAESDPNEKEMMIKLIVNLIHQE